ncbi:MAG: helix-turn-helix domain-containing protein [Rhodothermales bacterium]
MISAWELKPVEPAVKHIPKIIEFLGYLPFERGETPGQRIIIHRKTLGFSHYQFAKKLGVAPCTVMNWEHDKVKNVEKKIRPYLAGLVEFD